MFQQMNKSPFSFRFGPALLRAGRKAAFLSATIITLGFLAAPVHSQVSVLTQNADPGRDAAYTNETVLTPTSTIHKLFTVTLDSPAKGQALILGGLNVPGSPTNILLVATSPNESGGASSAWAFDADTGTKLWQLSLGSSSAFTTATPVIDPAAGPHGALYVLTKTTSNQLHAIDVIAGTELPGSPVTIAATAGSDTFSSGQQNDRSALLLLGGVVYTSFCHMTDSGTYHGWIIGYKYTGSSFTQNGVFCDSCAGSGNAGGIWQGGDGLVSDGTNIFVGTGNGTMLNGNYSMSVVKIGPSGNVLDSYLPPECPGSCGGDGDLNGGGLAMIPGTGGRLFQGPSKSGHMTLLDSTKLAGNQLQLFNVSGGIGKSPAAWNSGTAQYAYVWPSGNAIQQYCYDSSTGKFSGTTACAVSSFSSGGTLAISSTSTGGNGILWAYGNGVLHAMNPTNVAAADYWNSNLASGDSSGSPGGYQYLAIANGKVYAPTGSTINVYGIPSGGGTCSAPPTAPSALSASAVSAGQISLTWTAGTSSCAATYSVFRSTTSGFAPSSSNQIANGVGTASYTDDTAGGSTTYYYLVEEVNNAGASPASNQASATTPALGSQVLAINSGGPLVTPFVADVDFIGGGTISHANTINTSNAPDPAPAQVYQTGRTGNFSYTIPGFTAGTNYLVRLHFAETFFSAVGSRTFDVSINGTQVLTNFDIVAASGGQNIAVIEQFLEPANSSGDFVIAFTSVVNNSLVSGIEVDNATGTGCTSAPSVPGGLTATEASSSQINLSWTASTAPSGCSITYTVFHSTTNGFTPSSSNQAASGITGTSFSDTGLTASTTYYYLVEACDSFGCSAASSQAQATTGPACTAAPSAPTGLTATVISSSEIDLSWTASTAPSGCSITYSVTRNSTQVATGVTGTSYKDTGLACNTAFTYTVAAVDSFGSSGASNSASGTTSTCPTGPQINSGGPAVSPFVADVDFAGGGTISHANTIDLSKVTNPAPMAVYQTGRDGNFTYTIPGFTAGSSHLVRLHFAETYWGTSGSRTFNVSINGTQVLAAFDIFATAGGKNIANIQQFTENANSSGQYVIQFTTVKDNSLVNGIEIQ